MFRILGLDPNEGRPWNLESMCIVTHYLCCLTEVIDTMQ